jgi:hypothetical protein
MSDVTSMSMLLVLFLDFVVFLSARGSKCLSEIGLVHYFSWDSLPCDMKIMSSLKLMVRFSHVGN